MADESAWHAPGQAAPGQPPYGQQPPVYGAPGYGPGQQPHYAPPAWTPPPKPGLIPLRPLGFGTLIGAPFQVLKRNPRATFGSALLVQGLLVILSLLVVGGVTAFALSRVSMAEGADVDTVGAGAVAGIFASALVPLALSVVGAALIEGVIVLEVARATLGEKLTLRQLWRSLRGRLARLIGWVALVSVVIIAAIAALVVVVALLVSISPATIVIGVLAAIFGALGLVVLGVWIFTKLSLVPCAIVLERRGIGESIRRSWTLTNGYFWRTFGAQFLVAAIIGTVSQIVTLPFSLIFGIVMGVLAPTSGDELSDPEASGAAIVIAIASYALLLLVSLVIGAVTYVVQSAVIALIYIDLRMRKEGLDLELARFVERRASGAPVADPYDPSAFTHVPAV